MSDWNVRDYDHYHDHLDDNIEFWRHLRENEPVAKVDTYGGYYLVSRYADVDKALRDTNRFVSKYGTAISAGPSLKEPESPLVPIDSDPPLTGQYRKLVASGMAPGPMEARADEALAVARQLLDAVQSDRFDYVEAFADPFPREVTMRVIGFDLDDLDDVRPWLQAQANVPRDRPEFREAVIAGDEYLQKLVEERRRGEPRDDLISRVVFGEVDGLALAVKEAASLVKNLLMGALGTTTKTLTEAVYLFATQPHYADALRRDPSLWSTAVDEILRYSSVIHGNGRVVDVDTELAGCPMKRGDRLRVLLGSANRDSEVFERPDEFVIDRSPNRHLAFGQGAHKCIGQHLAKVMIRVALTELLDRYDPIELDDEVEIEIYAMESASAKANLPLRVKRV